MSILQYFSLKEVNLRQNNEAISANLRRLEVLPFSAGFYEKKEGLFENAIGNEVKMMPSVENDDLAKETKVVCWLLRLGRCCPSLMEFFVTFNQSQMFI